MYISMKREGVTFIAGKDTKICVIWELDVHWMFIRFVLSSEVMVRSELWKEKRVNDLKLSLDFLEGDRKSGNWIIKWICTRKICFKSADFNWVLYDAALFHIIKLIQRRRVFFSKQMSNCTSDLRRNVNK